MRQVGNPRLTAARRRRALVGAVCAAAAATTAQAQSGRHVRADSVPASGAGRSTSGVFAWLDVLTGEEASPQLRARLRRVLDGWSQDALGSWTITRGSGAPHRVVACVLDRPAYVVSEITDDGYLRLHDPAAPARQHPLWDQFHLGQRVRVVVSDGVADPQSYPGPGVPGVVGVRSTHLARRRAADSAVATVDEFYVDVGARSRAEALALGVRPLAPVAREWAPVVYGAGVPSGGTLDAWNAAPAAARRAGCDALAEVATTAPTSGRTTFVAAAQGAYASSGLAAVLARLGPVDSLYVLDAGTLAGEPSDSVAVTRTPARTALRVPGRPAVAGVALTVRARFRGTLVESVRRSDADALRDAVARAAGVEAARVTNSPAAAREFGWAPASAGVPGPERRDSLAPAARLLAHLANTYGVSGHEGRVREAVLAELPAWARGAARVDTAGNLVVAVGPDRDTVAVVAHLDEIGYEITAIRPDGQVALRPLGGFYASLWEGQPALLHFDARRPLTGPAAAAQEPGPGYYAFGDLRGVFVPRATATARQPAELTAWFGLDSAALVRAGVRVGQSVTGVKDATRLGPVRFAARSSDDRTGCTALLLAMRALDPARLTHKVVFAFTTREETGLFGAAALAAELGASVRRVYAVDTFVSSDAPLESHRFAYTPLGAGAVVRAVDNSSAAPPEVVDEVTALARRAGIPVQVGTTNGGNDGAEFARAGAVDVPLSWPGRYSHSPVEVCDLRDLVALARLISALALAPADPPPARH